MMDFLQRISRGAGTVSGALTLAFIVGIGLLSYGAWLAWHPLGFLVAGALMMLVPLWYARGGRT